jgi:membrane fusion protein, copper/silver efflux system
MNTQSQTIGLVFLFLLGACSTTAPDPVPAGNDDATHTEETVNHYTCPMHPSVQEKDPGICPICKMDLTAVTVHQMNTGEVVVKEAHRERIGVRTQVLKRRTLHRSFRALGEVRWDEARIKDVTARVEGWVERLNASRTGDRIGHGAVLLNLYSPALYSTQQELLNAPEGSRMAKKSRERLRLWGLSKPTIEGILSRQKALQKVPIHAPSAGVLLEKAVNEGAHVKAGDLLFRLADPSVVWVEAEVFEQDLVDLAEGQQVQVSRTHGGLPPIDGRIDRIYPTLDSTSRTGRIRITVPNTDGSLRPGMLAKVEMKIDLGEALAVSPDAVVHTGPRKVVYVDQGQGRLAPVEVTVGASTPEWTVIESGLKEGDTIVSSGVFLIAAESRIRSAPNDQEVSHAGH